MCFSLSTKLNYSQIFLSFYKSKKKLFLPEIDRFKNLDWKPKRDKKKKLDFQTCSRILETTHSILHKSAAQQLSQTRENYHIKMDGNSECALGCKTTK